MLDYIFFSKASGPPHPACYKWLCFFDHHPRARPHGKESLNPSLQVYEVTNLTRLLDRPSEMPLNISTFQNLLIRISESVFIILSKSLRFHQDCSKFHWEVALFHSAFYFSFFSIIFDSLFFSLVTLTWLSSLEDIKSTFF